jgi:hypothetical protein
MLFAVSRRGAGCVARWLSTITVLMTHAAFGQMSYKLVALEGQQALADSADVNYASFGSPRLNDQGHVAFTAALSGAGVTADNDMALYSGPHAAPTLVGREGEQAPDVGPGAQYWVLESPHLNDDGKVSYHAYLRGDGIQPFVNEGALYAGSALNPHLVVQAGQQAAGTGTGVRYDHFFTPTALSAGGHMAFLSSVFGGPVNIGESVIYASSPQGAVQLVARSGRQAPGAAAGVNYYALTEPFINRSGKVAYGASLSDGVDLNAVYFGQPASPQLVARNGQ